MKKIFFTIYLLLFTLAINAQDVKQMHYSIGGAFGTHQNQTFSKSSLSGGGIGIQIGYSKQGNNFLRYELDIPMQFYTIKGLSHTKSLFIEPVISVSWMKGIKKEEASRYYLGGELEASVLFRKSTELDNNAYSLLYNNTLSAAARMERPLGNSNWQLGGELSIGILSWVKASDGYAFTAPQDLLTEGDFSYQDQKATIALYRYGKLATIGKFNRVKTELTLFKEGDKARWGYQYSWNLKTYEAFTDGQMIQGTHVMRFFIGIRLGRKKAIQSDKR